MVVRGKPSKVILLLPFLCSPAIVFVPSSLEVVTAQFSLNLISVPHLGDLYCSPHLLPQYSHSGNVSFVESNFLFKNQILIIFRQIIILGIRVFATGDVATHHISKFIQITSALLKQEAADCVPL